MPLIDTLNFFTYEQLASYAYETIDGTQYFSIRLALTHDKSKIGNPPDNICTVEFEATSAIDAWECRGTLVGEPFGVGAGILLRSGPSVPGGTAQKFIIKSEQLVAGNGDYRITVYVKKNNVWYGGQ